MHIISRYEHSFVNLYFSYSPFPGDNFKDRQIVACTDFLFRHVESYTTVRIEEENIYQWLSTTKLVREGNYQMAPIHIFPYTKL